MSRERYANNKSTQVPLHQRVKRRHLPATFLLSFLATTKNPEIVSACSLVIGNERVVEQLFFS